MDPGTRYATDVVDGKVPTGELVRLACERHLQDLDGQPKNGLLWVPADGDKVARFISYHHHFKGKRFASSRCTCEDGDFENCPRRIHLLPWQAFVVYSIFAWKIRNEDGDWTRRFTEAYAQMSRKQGKTHLALPIGNYVVFGDDEPAAEGYIAGTVQHQSLYIHKLLKEMIRASPALRERLDGWERKVSNVADLDSGSYIQAVSSDATNLDALSPKFVLLDELHEHKDAGVRQTLKTGMGLHDDPLLLEITTPGEDKPGSICRAVRDYCESVLRGKVAGRRVFAFIAEVDRDDDWKDSSIYYKSNPSLGVTVRLSDLEAERDEALANPMTRAAFRIKKVGQWISISSGMFNMEALEACPSDQKISRLLGHRCFGGVDLAAKLDLNAFSLVFPPDIDDENAHDLDGEYRPIEFGEWNLILRFFIPETKAAERSLENQEIKEWIDAGLIEIMPGPCRRDSQIREAIEESAGQFDLVELGVDPWNAHELTRDLLAGGIPVVEVPQVMSSLSAPTKEILALAASARLNFGGHPVFWWNARNCAGQIDTKENIMADKRKSRQRIDGVSASVTAMNRALAALVEGQDEELTGESYFVS